MPKYNVVLKTADVDGAGTNAGVAVELRGQNGEAVDRARLSRPV